MKSFAGTWQLLKLALRLDRIKLPLWIVANVGIIALTLPQLISTYKDEAARAVYAVTTSSSIVSRLFGGALTGPSIGEISIVETYMLAALISALMSIFLVSRHTRQNEETNRSEVLGSLIVGHQAPLTAALLLALLANAVTSLLIILVFLANDFSLSGSVIYGLGVGLTGLVFAGVAAVTCQLFESTRAANGMAGLAFGILFLLKGIGDVLGTLLPGGMGVKTSWVSWLSPVGWAPNMKPFATEASWPLALFVLSITVLVGAGYFFLAKRDVGRAIFEQKDGRERAKPFLLSRFGLIWRLNRTSFLSWAAALMVAGATIGGVADEFEDLIKSNEEMQRVLEQLGAGNQDVAKIMFGAVFTMIGLTVAGYAIQVLTRMRSEETDGRLEVTLSAAKTRTSWLGNYTLFALSASFKILFLSGLSAGLVYGFVVGDAAKHALELGAAILVYLPVTAIMIGIGLVLYGSLPRKFTMLAWASLAACVLIFQLGAILNLPQWVINISPFTHTPIVPAVDVAWKPLIIQTFVALLLIVLGLFMFRRRDLVTE